MLLSYLNKGVVEAGCDEAGRGCLAGPVFAAAVILPPDFKNELLNDSKKLTEKQRYALRPIIEKEAIAWAVGVCDNKEIDKMNILKCSIEAMHRAVRALKVRPESLLIDGNRFYPFEDIPHKRYLLLEHSRCIAAVHRLEDARRAVPGLQLACQQRLSHQGSSSSHCQRGTLQVSPHDVPAAGSRR